MRPHRIAFIQEYLRIYFQSYLGICLFNALDSKFLLFTNIWSMRIWDSLLVMQIIFNFHSTKITMGARGLNPPKMAYVIY